MNYSDLIISLELIGGYFALLIITKLVGRITITQISTFDFIGVLILGDLVGAAMYTKEAAWSHMLIAMGTWTILIYTTALITQKSRKSRDLLEGKPVIIINKGKIDIKAMKKNLIDLDQLAMMLRLKDIFSFAEVEYAILESNGDISIMKKEAPPTNKQPHIVTISYLIIQDGKVITENFAQINKTQKWLEQELKKNNYHSAKEIFIAEWNDNYGLLLQNYTD